MCQTGIITLYSVKMNTQMKNAKRVIRKTWLLKAVRIFGRFAEISGVRTKEWVGLLLIG